MAFQFTRWCVQRCGMLTRVSDDHDSKSIEVASGLIRNTDEMDAGTSAGRKSVHLAGHFMGQRISHVSQSDRVGVAPNYGSRSVGFDQAREAEIARLGDRTASF